MSYSPKKIYIIVCEGPSEYAYLQELNRFLDALDASFTFVSKSSGGGHFRQVTQKFKDVKKDNKKASNINIWVDADTYKRNDEGDREKYSKKDNKYPDFLFNTFNFEDFLTMHLNEEKVLEWQNICERRNHFTNPMHSSTYEPLVKEHLFPDYEKGDMPFEITKDNLERLFNNNNNPDIKFGSEFANFLERLLEETKQ
ncbi:MAG: hypothetical protein R3Y43_07870 [Alphaproteobacteria bacterium]